MEPLRDQPPDLRSLLRTLWRRKWLFAAILISIPAAVFVISNLVTKTYEASALVRLEAVRTDVASLSTPTVTDIDTEALLLNTEKVQETAASALGGGSSGGAIGAAVRTEPLVTDSGGATDLLFVVASADDADVAADYANAYARAIDTVRTEKALKQLDKSIAGVQAQLRNSDDTVARAEFQGQLQLLQAGRDTAENDTQVVQVASPPSTPVSPHPRRNTALAALVALLLALGAVALAERLDRRLRDSSELEPLLDAPLLSVIPRGAFPGERPAPGPVREAFRTLAASLVYFNLEQPIKTVIVGSPTKGDGKTTVAVHLAVALARDGKRAVLVDCDLRHPQVAVRLGIEPPAGVVEVLTEQAKLADALVNVDVGDGSLEVLAAGGPPPNPARLLGSQRMDSLLERLSRRADIVVIDTPPILNVSDAVPLLERVSGAVVVAKVGATGKDALQRLRQVIETARGNILGAVATGSGGAGLYGYGTEYYGDETIVDLESPLPEGPIEEEPVSTPVADEAQVIEPDQPSSGADAFDGTEEREAVEPPAHPAEPLATWRVSVHPGNGREARSEESESERRAPAQVPLPPVEPTPVVEQPTQEWSATEEWDAVEDWGTPAEYDVPEGWNAPEDLEEPEEWDSGED